MLNSPVSRSTQPSPIWHYADRSPRVTQLSRRLSKSKTLSPHLPQRNYVDAATQWSPRMELKHQSAMNLEEASALETVSRSEAPYTPPVQIGTEKTAQMPQLLSKPDTPSMKRRQSPESTELPSSQTSSKVSQKRFKSISRSVKVLPLRYELCSVEDIVILVANMISELIETNDALPLRTGVLTRFHSRTPPGISVLDYLDRLAKHATLTPPLLLSMVYYIDRLCSLYPAFTITTLTVHRFLITAATVAAKGLSDSFWNNAWYARVGGVKLAELGLLELDFLYRVDWKIVPNPEVLVDYYRGLIERSDAYELEGNESTDEDDDIDADDDDIDSEPGPTENAQERITAMTDTKWNAWMADVSTRMIPRADASENSHQPDELESSREGSP